MANNNRPIILYMHAGSGNHGCEAIADSFSRMLKERPVLISYFAKEDEKYNLPSLCDIRQERSFSQHKLAHILYYAYRKVTKDSESFIRFRFKPFLSKKNQADMYPVAVSIGGDNYCYEMMLNDLFLTNGAFNRQGTKTVLLGCSIEPELIERKDINSDLRKYHTIIARESITYEALKEKLGGDTKIYCIPDPAFSLPVKPCELPVGFAEGNTLGINISPMIQDNESTPGITMKAYIKLVEYIIEETTMQIALIPHVVWDRNNDRKPIEEIYNYFCEKGHADRIVKVEDKDAESIKYVISKCRMFVGARTHATIAAYSTCVPTLVIGYSVKAKGIAKDLFKGLDSEKLVFPVQNLKSEDEIKDSFKWLLDNEDTIRKHLQDIMPAYVERCYEAAKLVKDLR